MPLKDVLLDELRDMYSAENQLVKALPKLGKGAKDAKLKELFTKHLEETKGQIERLQKVFQKLGKEPKATDCPAIDGIIKEADETAGEIDNKQVLDAAIVANSQAVEHYEISRYGTLKAWARKLNMPEAIKLLDQTLTEEKKTDETLSKIAETAVNYRAAA